MKKKCLALGFYQNSSTARAVFKRLKKEGFRRSAFIFHAHDGRIFLHTSISIFSKTTLFFIGLILGIFAAAFLSLFGLIELTSFLVIDLLIALSASIGVWLIFSAATKIDPEILNKFKNRVIRDETLVLVQIHSKEVRKVLSILRNVESGHPISFLLRQDSLEENSEEELPKEPLTTDQLQEHAIQLAESLQKITKKTSLHDEQLLQRLRHSGLILAQIRHDVSEAEQVEQTITQSAEWLLDNTHAIQGSIDDVQRNLPKKYYKELPKVAEGPMSGLPRVYVIAKEIINNTSGKLTRENIVLFLNSYQTIDPLTIGELWAIPLMLRLRLIECIQYLATHIDRRLREGEFASFWGNRLLNVTRRDPEHFEAFLKALAREHPHPSPHFAEELLDHLFDEESVLPPVRIWLEEQFSTNISDIILQEQMRKTVEQIAISNSITSLITLSQLSWREIFSEISQVDDILAKDPSGTYRQMDFGTCDTYRHSIEVIAKRSKRTEGEIASATLQLASAGTEEVTRHVGYYLVDSGRPILEKYVNYKATFFQHIRRWMIFHPNEVYLGSIGLITFAVEALLFQAALSAEIGLKQAVIFTILALLPASEIAVQLVNLLLARVLSPNILPKMLYEKNVPEELGTLVIVPMMLVSIDSIKENINRLEIHYLANENPVLRFGIFSDFLDAPQQNLEEDHILLDEAVKGIESLRNKYGKEKFFLFHRQRRFSDSEGAWIGYERKRGKLECLNRFLCGKPLQENILYVGQKEALNNIRYVITLDADTQLPKDKARQLIETISHPLNTPRLSSKGEIIRGYTIVQPRVSTDLPHSQTSLFAKIFSDVMGIDPYQQAISDVYQDLALEGTYHGKGIYDVHAFDTILSGRFPDEHLLSHDLLEGAYVRVGFASDISLFDSFPENYLAWSKRHRRWMRGDWQIIDWLSSSVPSKGQQTVHNPLSAINRWKILDNLRRALLPAATILLLISAWLFSNTSLMWTSLAAVVLFMPAISMFVSNYLLHPTNILKTWKEPASGLIKSFIMIALLPHQAYLSLDALFRIIYRRHISHRNLLEWMGNNHSLTANHSHFHIRLWVCSLFAVLVGLSVIYINPESLNVALAFCVFWFASPLIVQILDRPIIKDPAFSVTKENRRMLRQMARSTWRYFDDFVGPQSHWLPPDNYQAALGVEIAQRTSPTNIGLWMVSALSAYDLKYITCDDAVDRILETFHTLNKLERYEGHLLNWYDIQSLLPLYPRYVSTVDSGNLIASLWVLEHGIHEMLISPVISPSSFEGIKDTFDLLTQENRVKSLGIDLEPLRTVIHDDPVTLFEFLRNVQKARVLVQELLILEGAPHAYWLKQVEEEIHGLESLISRYFGWAVAFFEISDRQLLLIDEHAIAWKNHILNTFPSLQMLVSGTTSDGLQLLLAASEKKNDLPEDLKTSLKKIKEGVETAKWLSGERIALAYSLIKECGQLSDSMNMQFLYNTDRKVFAIGYQVDNRKLDNSYYDLLASEARIASLVSIAKGDAPVEHWWALGRSYAIVDGVQVLKSWGGTMFEYLMPLLFTKHYSNSLLGDACQAAVSCQINYGKKRGIPWGISESAFSAIDARKTYQYRSFGVPGMGFKRDLEEDLVVSPYSTALALTIDPISSIENLKRLANHPYKLLNEYGYYEAIDFARQQDSSGERGVIIYAYMVHHEGMSFISINNLLNNNIIQKRFHADPRIAGVESLLYERVPLNPPLAKGFRKEIPIPRLTPFPNIPIMGLVTTPYSATPKVNLLSNGIYSIMVTNSGGGYSRWRDFDITRWLTDTTCDSWGSFCYIKDVESGDVWSSTFQPTLRKGPLYSVSFKADRVEIRRRDNQIEILTEIAVSPEDNAEIRLMTFANLSSKTRILELTSYCELALAPHATDRTHPCFNKLFIQTEALPELSGLLAFRRMRSPDDQPIWAAHTISCNQPADLPIEQSIQFETDRSRFIGRGKGLSYPAAINERLSGTQGTVLDPIFSLRRRIVLEPGERIQVSFITAVAENRDGAISLVKKYVDFSASQRALEMAWTYAELELRHLRIHQEEAQLFQKLASRVLYPHSQLRPSTERLRKNLLGQSRLWSHGISGDLPIVVVTIADVHEIDLVKQVLTAHVFWRLRGLKTDLIILNEEATAYGHPLFEQLQRIVQAHSHHDLIEKPGGIFLRNSDQMPEEDLTLILSIARANLIAARGFLRQQLVSPMQSITQPPRLIPNKRIKDFPSSPLPFLELPYFNGYGGFTPDGREYVIYLGPNTHTPAPWINVLSNPQFGTIVSETGLGCTWFGNSQTNRLTPWSNDPVLNPITDAIYIRDEELGTYWTATAGPIRELDAYRIRHGQGYTRVEHNSHGIEQDLLIFVPVDNDGGLPVRIQRLRLINRSPRRRRLTATAFTEWVLGSNKEESQMHVITEWDLESQAIFAYNRYHPDYSSHVAFACSNPSTTSFSSDRTEFFGRNGSACNPAALKRKGLSGNIGAALDPCAALQVAVDLEPGEQKDVVFVLGYAPDAESARNMLLKCREPTFIVNALATTQNWWDKLLEKIQIETPDLALNFAMNRWLLYQNLSCRIWGRTAFYQSSGAYGFRDQLQDVASLVYSAPHIAREQILRAAGRQFEEGDVQHWWHPASGAGVRTHITDDLLWLPYITSHYVRVTHDLSILDEQIPFIKGDLLKEDQHEAYFVPEISSEIASLLEHCRRSIRKGVTAGPHGLPLIGGGDWNDGMNRVGIQGKGESVWLAWFLIQVMNDFADTLDQIDPSAGRGEGLRAQAKRLAETVELNAWDGEWYRRAYFDDGAPLGSKDNMEACIDSLAQSWAVICGAANAERTTTALKSLEKHLIKTSEGLVLLLTPPFDKTSLDPGYIKGYPPGVRENGGQYTHGSLWVPMAFARKGDGDKAAFLLQMMLASSHAHNVDESNRYKVEPYAVAADIYSLEGQVGRGGWTWYTGSAGWMYRIWLEELFGFKLRGQTLTLNPVLPAAWESVKLKYHHLSAHYEITIENPNHKIWGSSARIELDGVFIADGQILLADDGKNHVIRVVNNLS